MGENRKLRPIVLFAASVIIAVGGWYVGLPAGNGCANADGVAALFNCPR
jgi:hypothetical protein